MRRLAVCTAVVTGALTLLLSTVPAHATFPGKNGRIAYLLDKGSGSQLYTIRPDGTGRRQLTHVAGSVVAPDWSPDGLQIAFEFDHASGPVHCSVEIMNADGTNVRDLTGNRTGACDGAPSFTPGGHRIVFTSEGGENIRSMTLLGKDRRLILHSGPRLGQGDRIVKRPQVSPDGRTVLFGVEQFLGTIGGLDANVKALYTVRMDGTHLVEVVPFDLDVCSCGGDWAPNGKRIVSGDNAGFGGPQTRPTNIFTIRPDGTGLQFVTHFNTIEVIAGNGSYSPDGRWIVIRTQRGDRNAMWEIHPDGTGKTLIARFQFPPGARDWGARPT